MKLLIDADGCPVVKQTVKIAQQLQCEVVIVCDYAHQIEIDGVETVTVMQGSDAVDYEIISRLQAGDLVVTQDYGLAALALSKKGRAINQNGLIYTEENIDQLLFSRAFSQKIRKSGQRLKGPKKRTKLDDETYIMKLQELLTKGLQ